MAEIIFSFPLWSQEYVSMYQELMQDFESQTHIKVELLPVPLEVEKSEINRFALYHKGPDVTHLGTTWVRDLVAMQALRPFTDADVQKMGGKEAFLPGSWQSYRLAGDPDIWAIPYIVEALTIQYRKDLLEQAGVDPAEAFASITNLVEAAQELSQTGIDVPVEVPAAGAWNSLHALSGWVWAEGAEYCSPNGHEVWFNRPEVMKIIVRYFSALKCLSDKGREWLARDAGSLFQQGRSAICFYPFADRLPARELAPGVYANWFAAAYPGQNTSYLGGQDLVIWKHTRFEEASVELITYLTSVPVMHKILQGGIHLPARAEVYTHPDINRDPVFDAQLTAIRNGRTYPAVPLWSMIEDRLLHALGQIQIALLADPALDVEETVKKFLDALAKRLNVTLAR